MTGERTVFTMFNEFHAPLLLAAPEAIRGWPGPYSPPINIWAVGHLVRTFLLRVCVQRAIRGLTSLRPRPRHRNSCSSVLQAR